MNIHFANKMPCVELEALPEIETVVIAGDLISNEYLPSAYSFMAPVLWLAGLLPPVTSLKRWQLSHDVRIQAAVEGIQSIAAVARAEMELLVQGSRFEPICYTGEDAEFTVRALRNVSRRPRQTVIDECVPLFVDDPVGLAKSMVSSIRTAYNVQNLAMPSELPSGRLSRRSEKLTLYEMQRQ